MILIAHDRVIFKPGASVLQRPAAESHNPELRFGTRRNLSRFVGCLGSLRGFSATLTLLD
jgi:hypothetical protein